MRLAYTGAVKDDILDTETLGCHLMELLAREYPQALTERYKIDIPEEIDGWELLQAAGRKRGFLVSRGEVDTERMARVLLDEYRSCKLGTFHARAPGGAAMKEEPKDLWLYENEAFSEGFETVCGVDEAGRGPLAGPVCAAAVILPKGLVIDGLNDSKKLTDKNGASFTM